MAAVGCSGTLMTIYWTIRRHIPEGLNLQT